MAAKNHRTMIGGQAVIEGVMMRGAKVASMAVRAPDGTITTDIWETVSAKDKLAFLKLPFLRGIVNFVEMLVFGTKCLMRSADISMPQEEEEPAVDPAEKAKRDKTQNALTGFSFLIGIVIAVGLFIVLPATIVNFMKGALDSSGVGWIKTLLEGLIRIVIFIGYLAAISQMKDIQRVFQYHGAEHKSIFCYEHGDELIVENARKCGRLHPRCGTSFLLIVLIVSILVFSFVTWNVIYLRILLHVLLLPLVVGISYEIIRFAGRHDTSAMRFLLAPGLWLQKLTTREPDDGQIEVALTALKAVLTGNREDDKW
ncbi:MAG: DUF1385 domain-containing protein [Clostridia bacterium]|nr:DUF1385 domain-containing protein [Clostridia bacterium]